MLTPRQEAAVRALIEGRAKRYGVQGRWSVRVEDGDLVLESYAHTWVARIPLPRDRPRPAED